MTVSRFEPSASYRVRVCYHPCCSATFCACKPSFAVLTVVRLTPKYVILAPCAAARGGVEAGPQRRRLKHQGTSFDIDLIDMGDQMRRLVRTTVYACDRLGDDGGVSDSDDDVPLAVLAKRQRTTA